MSSRKNKLTWPECLIFNVSALSWSKKSSRQKILKASGIFKNLSQRKNKVKICR